MRRGVGWAVLGVGALLWACTRPSVSGDSSGDSPGDSAGVSPATVVVDDFETIGPWSPHPGDGVELTLRSDEGATGRSLRCDFRFHGGGYAVARRELDLKLPENYVFSFRVRGDSPPNHLEFKLIDASGDNVWWNVHRDVEFSSQWRTFTIKKRQIRYAWGPQGGGEISRVAAIEFAITAGSGGVGTVWIDELTLRPLPPPDAIPPPPVARASSSQGGHGPELALDGDLASVWRPAPEDNAPWLELDLRGPREYGGLVLDWTLVGPAVFNYRVEISADGTTWSTVRKVEGGNGGRDYLYLPESESRYVRLGGLTGDRAGGVALAEVTVEPLSWSASRESFFAAIAKDATRGVYPRGLRGEPSFWTVVGPASSSREGLLGADGALEVGKREFSVEPFLFLDGRLVTWADVRTAQFLEEGRLPIPSVTWDHEDVRLTVTVPGTGGSNAGLFPRYRVENRRSVPLQVTLYLVIRSFQVNPPAQALNTPGGCAPIRRLDGPMIHVNGNRRLEARGPVVRVNGNRIVASLTEAADFRAVTFDGGDVVADYLSRGVLPVARKVEDPIEAASGAFAYPLEITPGGHADVALSIPLNPADSRAVAEAEALDPAQVLEWSRESWTHLNNVTIQLPSSAGHALESFYSQVGFIVVNAAGPAIQPGARAYARSWIRDGALTSSALLRLGYEYEVRSFIDWYAPHQYANGKIPCVVDARGADPVPEHDSTGEFLFLVAEHYRFTKDKDLVERHWPRIVRGVAYLDSLRSERRTEEYQRPENARYYGILPPSISHEGYSAKPMHSYWDDFFALRGFKDAAYLASELDHPDDAARFGRIRDEFQQDLGASIEAALRDHHIDYIPGCADLGDFDATSTTIALSPAQADFLPRAAVEATFEQYYANFRERRDGAPWEAFTPYEIRNIGAFVRLGWRDRAQELLEYFLDHQSPPGWRQWAEVVWRDTTTAHFIGDLPHTWVGSDYIRSFLDMLAYEREADDALVLAAGVPMAWIEEEPGVEVRDLATRFGGLSYTLRRQGDVVEARIVHLGRIPPGGIVLRPPLPDPVPSAYLNGAPVETGPEGEVVVRKVPSSVDWGPRPNDPGNR